MLLLSVSPMRGLFICPNYFTRRIVWW